jgi:hypothetical protein
VLVKCDAAASISLHPCALNNIDCVRGQGVGGGGGAVTGNWTGNSFVRSCYDTCQTL